MSDSKKNLLKNYPVQVKIPIAWGDMDAFQHVNNTQYFKYCETTRIRCFEEIGLIRYMAAYQIGPILAQIQCKFMKPLFYPDTITVGVKIEGLQETGFEMHYRMLSHQSDKVVAEAQDRIVIYNYQEKQKAILPAKIREQILAL